MKQEFERLAYRLYKEIAETRALIPFEKDPRKRKGLEMKCYHKEKLLKEGEEIWEEDEKDEIKKKISSSVSLFCH